MEYPLAYYHPKAALIFLHIPKTAGMSFRRLLGENFAPESTYQLYPYDPQEALETFRGLPEETREQFDLVVGHQPFGIHQFIPRQSTYVTFFRDPVERVLSMFSFAREQPKHPLYEELRRNNTTLDEFLVGPHSSQVCNLQTRLISGGRCPESEPESALQWAQHHLRYHFCAIGLTERFPESLALMRNTLRFEKVLIPEENRTGQRLRADDLAPETLRTIQEKNALDIELYSFAERVFDILVEQQGPNFSKDVRALYRTSTQPALLPIARKVKRLVRVGQRDR